MHAYGGRPSDLFGQDRFRYEAAEDLYHCPAGNKLYPKSGDKVQRGIEYAVRKGACDGCPLRDECTRAKAGRTLLRRWGQEFIDSGMRESSTQEGRAARRRRKWVMEGSFAQGANLHGLKQSRWRRLWRQRTQDHFIGAVQNVKILINRAGKDYETGAKAALPDTSSRRYLHSKGIYDRLLPRLGILTKKVRHLWFPIPAIPHFFRPFHSLIYSGYSEF